MSASRVEPFRAIKDPEAVLDYSIDWSEWLVDGDALSDSDWSAEDGITIDNDTLVGNITTVWLSGGSVNKSYRVVCHITTTGGREDDRSIFVKMAEK